MNCRTRHFEDATLTPAERDARRQVGRLRGFYVHLTVFAAVNAGLLAINLLASPGRLWFFWPLAGWGIWLALHAVGTFARGHWLGAEWEERKMRELMTAKGMK